jgi:hypothetical protein
MAGTSETAAGRTNVCTEWGEMRASGSGKDFSRGGDAREQGRAAYRKMQMQLRQWGHTRLRSDRKGSLCSAHSEGTEGWTSW